MSSLNSKYLKINLKINKLKTHIKFLINNYTFHNEKNPREIITTYETLLNEIQLCYDEFVKSCEHFENVVTEAEQLAIYFDSEIQKLAAKLDLDSKTIETLDEDLAFLNDEPTVLENSAILNASSPESVHCQDDLNTSGVQYMNDSLESTPSPDDAIFVSKNNPSAGLATPMVKSDRKKLLRKLLYKPNIHNV